MTPSQSSRVSVVIPHYNHGEFIELTLQSICSQTVPCSELIVVDDGSDDARSRDALRQLSARPRVRVIYQDHRHVAAARNTGIRAARCPHIFVMDSDDLVEPTFLEECLAVLDRRPSVGIVSSWLRTFGVGEWLVKPQGGDVRNFLHKNNCPGQAVFRRACWEQAGGYKEELRNDSEDWEFYLSVLELGWHAHIVEKPLIRYRLRQVSANSEAQTRRPELYKRIVELHAETYHRYLTETLCRKEQQAVEKYAVIRDMMLRHGDLELPEVTFGDGGMAFRTAVECARASTRSQSQHP